jgi:pyochelin biosynthesis protein PchC
MAETTNERMLQPWIAKDAGGPTALAFCIPHAGGGASTTRPLAGVAPPDLGIVGVRLPGRESLFAEPMPTSVDTMVMRLADVIEDYAQRRGLPFVVVGQCSGSTLTYLLALEFENRSDPQFKGCVLASSVPPADVLADSIFSAGLDANAVFAEFMRRGSIPNSVAADPEAAAMFGATLFKDVSLLATLKPTSGKLNCPSIVIRGDADPVISAAAWQHWTTDAGPDVRFREIRGGHFLFADAPAAIVRATQDLLNGVDAQFASPRQPARLPTQ